MLGELWLCSGKLVGRSWEHAENDEANTFRIEFVISL